MSDKDTFFIVWNPRGQNPRARHSSSSAALVEAKRLASLNDGQEFFVMEARHLAVTQRVSVTTFDGEMPF